METYGVCLDEAMEGRFGAPFVASLAMQLPQDARWRVSYDPDAWWTGDRMLQAALVNAFSALLWGMGDKKRRGPRPKPVGPSWAIDKGRTVPATTMSKERLLELLALPRSEVIDDGR